MTVTELKEELQKLEDKGFGDLDVLINGYFVDFPSVNEEGEYIEL